MPGLSGSAGCSATCHATDRIPKVITTFLFRSFFYTFADLPGHDCPGNNPLTSRSSAVLIDEITEHRSSGPGAQKSRLTAILSAYPKLLGIWNSGTLQYPLSGS